MILQSLFVQAPQSPQDPHPDAEQFSPDELAIRHHTFFSPWNATLLRQWQDRYLCLSMRQDNLLPATHWVAPVTKIFLKHKKNLHEALT